MPQPIWNAQPATIYRIHDRSWRESLEAASCFDCYTFLNEFTEVTILDASNSTRLHSIKFSLAAKASPDHRQVPPFDVLWFTAGSISNPS